MRTTVTIDDALLAIAKERAASSGRTLSDVLADALRESLNRPAAHEARRFEMVTFGEGGTQPGVDLDDSAALLDVMEERPPHAAA